MAVYVTMIDALYIIDGTPATTCSLLMHSVKEFKRSFFAQVQAQSTNGVICFDVSSGWRESRVGNFAWFELGMKFRCRIFISTYDGVY
eukprot:scaffold3790_cov103-Skeletonema_marinoi.AAC.2